MKIIEWCNKIIKYSYYLLFALVPLILTPWNYELFEFNKMIVTYALTVVIMTAWVIKMAIEKKLFIRRTIVDIPLILFVLSQLVSSLFSIDTHVSWFGYYSRFNGGMLSIFCYLFLYYAFVSNINQKPQDPEHQTNIEPSSMLTMLYIALGTAVVVSLYGILEHFGIDKNIWVQDVQNRVFSTLGQPNWLAAYLVALMPLTLYLAIEPFINTHKNIPRSRGLIFASLYGLFYVTLLFTRSRSGMFAFAVVLGLFVVVTTVESLIRFFQQHSLNSDSLKNFLGGRKAIILSFLAIHLVLASFTFFNGTNIDKIDTYFSYKALQSHLASRNAPAQAAPAETAQPSGTLLEYGGTESGTIRKYVWEAAITAWRSSQKAFFIGTGTETFAFAFFQYKPIGHNLTSEWDFLYNKAHNEYLNYLATTGILGLGSYLLLLGVFTIWFLQYKVRTESHHEPESHARNNALMLVLFCGWISILITNFFGFSVVIVQIFLFLFPAFIALLASKTLKEKHILIPERTGQIVTVIAMVLGTLGTMYVCVMWLGDYYYASGYRQSRSGQLSESYKNLIQSTFLRPKEPMYYDELSVVLGSLSIASLEAGNATAASELAQQSLAASDIALSISPNNVNFWKSRTKIYFGFADLDPKFVQAAYDSLAKASSLSPFDPKITYNLAVLDGRLGNNEKAIETLKKTVAMKPNYRDAYYALNIFYTEAKQPELAKSVLEEYLKKVDPNDKEFLEKVK